MASGDERAWPLDASEGLTQNRQFATYAPVFRTHCRFCEQRVWTFGPVFFPLMRQAMVLRNALVPYIYTSEQCELLAC